LKDHALASNAKEPHPFKFLLVGEEPVAIVVALETGEKAEQFGGEVDGHAKIKIR
jgi:hypothetical protein